MSVWCGVRSRSSKVARNFNRVSFHLVCRASWVIGQEGPEELFDHGAVVEVDADGLARLVEPDVGDLDGGAVFDLSQERSKAAALGALGGDLDDFAVPVAHGPAVSICGYLNS